MYTAQGIYTPDGGQTQRIGLSPDIEVKKTIEGIKEGRDEVKEAAIAYIQKQSQSATAAEGEGEPPLGSEENPIAEEPRAE